MSTRVTITGTGTPIQNADRAGPGVLVESNGRKFQFDAGRGTVMRLAEAGSNLTDLTALFVTHHHSDHIAGIPDLLMTRWLNDIEKIGIPDLPVHSPQGRASEIIEGLLDVWRPEMRMRRDHTGRPNIAGVDSRPFVANKEQPIEVAVFADTTISAVAVEHAPVDGAVAFRVDTADGSVVISGDTAVCEQVEAMSQDADVLVHEAIRAAGLPGLVSNPAKLLAYHAEPAGIGQLAHRARVKHLILTHMVPAPRNGEEKDQYEAEVRSGGFSGQITVADDLFSTHL